MVGTLAILVSAAILLARGNGRAAGTPFVPGDDLQVLERVPARRTDPGAREMDELRVALASDPTNVDYAAAFARRNIEESRATSDPRFLGHAQAALAPWWGAPSPPPGVRLLRATIRQSLHDFDGALADLTLLCRETPDDPQAWLTRAVVLTVRGEYLEARRSCEPLSRLAGKLVAAQCVAVIDSLTGQAKRAYQSLRAAYAEERAPTPSEANWILSSLGEIAVRAGDDAAGEADYRSALAANRHDAYTLSAYADLLLERGRPAEVLPLLRGHENDDGLLLRLTLAEKATGDSTTEKHVDMLRARHRASRARGDVVHRREQARFALQLEGDPASALELATANWGVQREPSDARVLLESGLSARRPEAADAVVEFLAAHHAEEPRLVALAARVRERRP
ncbi:MAG: hypothetical protein M3O36_13645 [Myxococcota bacterium]|nr:hypothetical protein [Myxococcota bacterium]